MVKRPLEVPSINHLKIFGSLCYKHIPDAKRWYLEDKTKSMILVGYHNTWAYILFDPGIKHLAISRDMVILEDEACNWNAKEKDAINILVCIHSETCEVEEIDTLDIEKIRILMMKNLHQHMPDHKEYDNFLRGYLIMI